MSVQISLRALAKHFSISVSTLKEALDKSTKIIQKQLKGQKCENVFHTMRSLVQHAKRTAFTFLNTAEIEYISSDTRKYKHIMDHIMKESIYKRRYNNVSKDDCCFDNYCSEVPYIYLV